MNIWKVAQNVQYGWFGVVGGDQSKSYTHHSIKYKFSCSFSDFVWDKYALFWLSRKSYSIVRSAGELKPGDLISLPFNSSCVSVPLCETRHHAVVAAQQGFTSESKFKIIHATYHDGGKVSEDVVNLDKHIRRGDVHRYDYEPYACFEPMQVIANARSRIGKFAFDSLRNNCEHFARWCKTGQSVSYQAQSTGSAMVASSGAVVTSGISSTSTGGWGSW